MSNEKRDPAEPEVRPETDAREPYEAPKIQSIQLSADAADAMT